MAAADPHGDPHDRDRPAHCHSLHLPRLRLRPRCRRPLEASEPSWTIRHHPWPMPRVCGGAVGSALSSVREKGLARRCERTRRGLWACSGCPSPRAGSCGQGTAAYPCPTIEKFVRWHLVLLWSPHDGASDRTLKSADHERLGRNIQNTRFCFCDGDRCEGR